MKSRNRQWIEFAVLLSLLVLSATTLAEALAEPLPPLEPLQFDWTYDAPVESLWRLWTTEEGIREFFAPASHVDLKPGGAYEIFFNPDAPVGLRGADDMRLLVVEPMTRLAFTWNAPVRFGPLREQRTRVTLLFHPLGDSRTRLILLHDGWGADEAWKEVRAYFQAAWGEVVLPSLAEALVGSES